MRELTGFQQMFGRALLSGEAVPGLELALTIHRNTSFKGLTDALAANYPTVAQLVGEEWFRAAAIEFARAYPARSPVLAVHGEEFPAFLADFPPAGELPYLAEVAAIDRLWVEAHTARDAAVLAGTDLSKLPQSTLAALRLSLHPATRIAWVRHSAATVWIHHRSPDAGLELNVDDSDEGILLTRPAGRVEHHRLDRAAFEFLQCLRKGDSLSAAAETALTCDGSTNVAALLARTLVAGSFECPAERLS